MRAGGEYFLEPAEAVQRRYEALRCYFVEDASAESVGARFGYSRLLTRDRSPARRRATRRSEQLLPFLQARSEGATQDPHHPGPGAGVARRRPFGDRDRPSAHCPRRRGVGPDGVGDFEVRGPGTARTTRPGRPGAAAGTGHGQGPRTSKSPTPSGPTPRLLG